MDLKAWSIDGKDSWFFKKDQAVIGAMADLGVHKADLLRFILGEEIIEVAAFIETSAKKETVLTICRLYFTNGEWYYWDTCC